MTDLGPLYMHFRAFWFISVHLGQTLETVFRAWKTAIELGFQGRLWKILAASTNLLMPKLRQLI